jgi:hypothetical protein
MNRKHAFVERVYSRKKLLHYMEKVNAKDQGISGPRAYRAPVHIWLSIKTFEHYAPPRKDAIQWILQDTPDPLPFLSSLR